MVSLHTSWDAFSFISVSLVSVRASYSRPRSQVSSTEITGVTLPQHARWCWALRHPGRPSHIWPHGVLISTLWLIGSLFCLPGIPCPASFKDPFIFKTQLFLSPLGPLEPMWTSPSLIPRLEPLPQDFSLPYTSLPMLNFWCLNVPIQSPSRVPEP